MRDYQYQSKRPGCTTGGPPRDLSDLWFDEAVKSYERLCRTGKIAPKHHRNYHPLSEIYAAIYRLFQSLNRRGALDNAAILAAVQAASAGDQGLERAIWQAYSNSLEIRSRVMELNKDA